MNPTTFSAIVEPNRFQIIELLRNGPRPVNEISLMLKLTQPQTSKHLRVLSDVGIVDVHPEKQQRFYALNPQSFKKLDKWLDRYRKIWDERFDRLDKVLEHEKNRILKQNQKGVKKKW